MRKMKDSGIEWIGQIPQEWKIGRVKHIYDVTLGKMLQPAPKSDEDELCAYMCAANINWSGVDLSVVKKMWFSEKDKESYRLATGDLLVTEGGDVAVSCIWNDELPECYIQNAVHRVRPKSDGSNRYLYYWLSTLKATGYIDLVCNKATLAHFTKDKFDSCVIPVVSADEQHAIANYLDVKCAEIDALIAAKEKTNALLKERRQSIIYEAVTKGLNPDAPMKDSGIEWIGQIPEGWIICKIKHFVVDEDGVRIGPFGSALTNKLLENSDYNVYSQANLIAGDFSSTKHTVDEETFTDLKNYEVLPDDICVSMMGTIGKCRVVPTTIKKGIMDSHLIKIRLKPHVNPKFFEYVYDKDNSGLCFVQMKRDSKGTIMDGLNSTIVKNLYFPLPSRETQDEIVTYLERKCEELDLAISANEATIKKLKAYRQSIIYEAVTGKIEI